MHSLLVSLIWAQNLTGRDSQGLRCMIESHSTEANVRSEQTHASKSQNSSEVERNFEVCRGLAVTHWEEGPWQLTFNYSGLIAQLVAFSGFLLLFLPTPSPSCLLGTSLAPQPEARWGWGWKGEARGMCGEVRGQK